MLEYKHFNLGFVAWLTLLATAAICQTQPLTITTTQLPFGQLNLPYNAQLNATGGAPPYTWSYLGGGLPPGLSVSPSGVISGTPTGPGDNFLVQVTDANFPQSMPAQTTLFIGLCGTTANPSSQGHTFEDSGGSDVLGVSNPCGPLTPGTTVPWISITGILNGDGFDNINITVAPNSTPLTRTGNVTFTYNQVSPVLVISYSITQYAKLLFSTPSPLPLGVVGVPYSHMLQATGGSGISRSFALTSGSLPPGLSFSGQTISGTPALPGTSAFTASVTDQDGFSGTPFSASQNYALPVVPPLTITSAVLPGGIVGLSYSTTLAATGGVPPYSWSVASGALPSGLLLNPANGAIGGTPALNSQGSYAFTIRAADSAGLVSTVPFQLLVDPPPLVIRNPSLAAATEGTAYGATLTATGGTPPYSWSASGLPLWLSLTSAGQLSGTPPLGLGSAGSYNFTITVGDSGSRFTGVSFTLQVNPGPPVITTGSALQRAKEGTPISLAFQARGGVSPYTWTATGLPPFLNLSGAGQLSGTPPVGSSAGSYNFSVTLADAAGNKTSSAFSLSIDPALSITTTSSLQATEGQALSATFNASGGTAPYSFSASGMPGWAIMSAAGALSGTPPLGSAGGSTLAVVATDATNHTSSASFALTVLSSNGGLTITTPSPLASAGVGNYYQATCSATGGSPPYRWSGSGIPAGLTLSSGGLLSGTPTTAGNDTVTAQVTDSSGKVAFQALSLSVTPVTQHILTLSPLAAAEVSVAYSVAFQSVDAARPLVWSVSGPLPPGMTFDSTGVLSGTPSAPGDFVFTVQVTDSTGATASAGYEVLVRPFAPDLLVSAGGLSFTGVRGAAVPPVQTVSVISTTHDSVPFSASVDAPWIIATASGTTPGRIDVSVDQTGLSIGSYSGSITVSAPNRAALSIKVGLTVTGAPAILQASPQALDFFSDGTLASLSQNIYIRDSGPGSLAFTVSTDVLRMSVSPGSGTVNPSADAILTATVNVQQLAPGAYAGNIEIDSANGTARIPVSLLVSSKPKLILSDTGILLRARQGNGVSGPTPQSFGVSSSSGSTINFTTQQIGGDGWLQILNDPPPGTVQFTTTSAGLQKGAYYALVRVSSPDVFNSPQDFVVVLNIVDAASAPVPNTFPSGLVFRSSGIQNVSVYSSTDQTAPYQVAVSTDNGAGWLSATPATGTISTTAPAQLAVSVNGANLLPGIYRGRVHISISNLEVRTVNVTFIIPGSAPQAGMIAALADTPQANCTPANLVVTPTSLAGNFSTPAAWPRTVAVQLADDCGNSVSSGRVVAQFSNGDPPLSLNLSNASSAAYSATWTPSHAATQLTVTTQATASGLQTASAQILGAVSDTVAPVLAHNGILHNLYPQPGTPLAPGTIVQVFGSAMASTTSSTGIPLPSVLNGTSVLIGGELAPLYYVSSGQINAQIPVNLVPGQQYQVLVVANNAYTMPDTINIAPVTPGIARLSNGQVIAQHADFSLVTEDAPAKPGEYLVAYLAGMGLTDTPVGTGAQAPSSPLAAVNTTASVAIDGETAPVLFAGLTPGFIGLYQINFQVPADAQSGNRKLEIFQAGLAANTSVLPVQ
ncbi:MAG TPA: putative Ig domain-containing protein [Bryobacteraceae bacterium]|jgi:uncharacterized protein (TIGR03437 family)|nr:putative Ig domain-containing protein [Bryobacteraceae bacterium]